MGASHFIAGNWIDGAGAAFSSHDPVTGAAIWTGAAATVWAVAHVLLGYVAGAGWRHVHQLTGRIGIALAGAVLVALAVAWLLRRARGHQDKPRQPVAAGWRRA